MNTAQLAARLDRLPVGHFHRRVLYALAVAFVFEFGDLNTFAYAAPALQDHLGITVGDIGFITSASFLGMFVGGVAGGRFADHVGRRRALIWSVVAFSIFSLLNAVATDVSTLALTRLLTGIGLSAMTVAATTYLSETMPAARRGRMQAGVMAIGLLGIPVMSFSARGLIPLGTQTWRLVFVFGGLGLLTLPLIARLPESPRWLLRSGGAERAEEALRRIEREAEREVGALPAPEAVTPAVAEPAGVGYRALLTGRLGRRTLMLGTAWVFQTLGFYGFVSWVPTLLAQHGFDLVHSLTFTALTTLGAVPGALLAWPLSDRFGRKVPIVVVASAVAVCGLLYGMTFNVVAIVAFGFCVNALIQTFAALLYTYTPELYPTHLRNSGNGLVYGLGRLSNIAGPLIVAATFSGFGYRAVFGYIAACWLIVAVTVGVFGVRTGRRNLEDLTEGTDPATPATAAGGAPPATAPVTGATPAASPVVSRTADGGGGPGPR